MANEKPRNTYVHYPLIRSGQLNLQELGLLTLITSHSGYCLQTAGTLGRQMQRSERTVRRIINSLVQKGVITKKYTTFKRMILKIVDKASQIAMAGTNNVTSMLSNLLKKRHDRTSVSIPDRTTMSQPTLKKTNKENFLGNLSKKLEGNRKNDQELAKLRDKMVMQLQSQLVSQAV
jgi:DNA-binding MarR family transcriptional regulator